MPVLVVKMITKLQARLDARRRVCAICKGDDGTRFGIYCCIKCRDYSIHIRCAISDSRSFLAVLSGEARFPGLVRLPIPDEHQNFVAYARGGYASRNTKYLPGHTLILHENAGDELMCDVCVKVIKKSTPFYSSTWTPSFFLHQYCVDLLPDFFFSHPAHNLRGDHILVLKTNDIGHVKPICHHCRCPTLRVFYECGDCQLRFDVSCALMPGFITHDAHATSHFLRLSDKSPSRGCHCCGRSLGQLGYECVTCPNFALHTWCAMLPKTLTHKFDPHPLRLITSGGGVAEICEICENGMNNKVWHYGCKECDQWFHIDCIPCLDLVSKIKSGGGSSKMVHSRLIRGLTLQGHGDDYCTHVADEYDILLSD